MPSYRANGIILRRSNYGETDRILTLYTREHGKISAIAKGARRPTSRLAAATELFSYIRCLLASGRNLDILTQAETRESFTNIRGDIRSIAYATYVVELVNEAIEDRAPNPGLFDTVLSSFYMMESGIDPEIVTRAFELHLMTESGYQPSLDSCARCGAAVSAGPVRFSPSLGGVVCEACGVAPDDMIDIGQDTLEAMKTLTYAEPAQLRDMRLSEKVRDEMGKAMRWYIRYRLEREMRSVEFIHALHAAFPNVL